MLLHTVYSICQKNRCAFPGAGSETTHTVPADVSSFTIDGLQSDSSYTVLVSPVLGSREGNPSILAVRTGLLELLLPFYWEKLLGFKQD